MRYFFLLFVLLTPVTAHVSYAQSDVNKHYYEQFEDSSFQKQMGSVFNTAFWLIIPALLIWFAYYITAGEFNRSSVLVFFFIIMATMLIPIGRANYIKSRLISKENVSRFGKDPIHTMRKYPLYYGIEKDKVLEMWGNPRTIDNRILGEERWVYSRREPIGKSQVTFGYSYAFLQGSFTGWEDLYEVRLLFRNGELVYTEPSLELIKKGRFQ